MKLLFCRRIICTIICLLLIASNFSLNVSAAVGDTFVSPAAGQKNLLLNSGFESVSGNEIKYWELSGGNWNAAPGAKSEQITTYNNSLRSACLSTTNTARDVYLTHKVRMIPGAIYQVSFWVCIKTMAQDAGIKFTVAYTDSGGKSAGSYNPTYSIKSGTQNEWIQYVHHFTSESAPNGVTSFRVRLLGGASTVYVDDVSLYAIELPQNIEEEEPVFPTEIIPDYDFLAPCEGAENLLLNADFENVKSSGALKSWTASGGTWNQETGVSIIEKSEEPTHVRNGNRSIKITNSFYVTRNNVTQWVHLEPHAMYQASVWVYSEKPGTANLRFSMAYWDATHKKNPGGYQTGAFRYINQKGKWTQYVVHFEALEKGDNEIEFRIDLFDGDGEVYVDDASLYMIAPSPKMQFQTNELFYYTEDTEGICEAKLYTKVYPEIENGTVDFLIKDGSNTLEKKQNAILDVDDTARFIFNLSKLQIGKEYIAEAVLRDKNGVIKETQSQTFIRYLPRPKALTEEGFYKEQVLDANGNLKDKLDRKGNPVYIDVMIAYTRPDNLSLLKEQGVTAYIRSVSSNIENDKMQAELDNAAKNGLKVLVGLYPNMLAAGHPDNVEMSKYYINKYKNHPALLGWAVLDEPSAYFKEAALPKVMEDSYKLIRSIDLVHPVYAVEATTEFLPLINKYVDILASDPYPYNTAPIAGKTANYMRAAAEATKFSKPTCSIVQLRTLNGYFPTVNEVRNMYYQALFEGTGMLGFYAFNNASGTKDLSQTDRWAGHVKFGDAEQDDAFDFFVYRKYPQFNMSMGISDRVWYATFIKNGRVYLFILNHDETNRSADSILANVPLVSDGGSVKINGFTAKCIYGDGPETVNGESSGFGVSIDKNAAFVYEITPNLVTDFSELSISTFRDLGRHGWAQDAIRTLCNTGIITGITKTAFRPDYIESSPTFAQSLGKIFGISGETLLSAAGVETMKDLKRDDMMKIVFCALEKSNLDFQIGIEVASYIKNNMLIRNLDATSDAVTRAESAIVLKKIKDLKDSFNIVLIDKGKFYGKDAKTVSSRLLNEQGTFSGGIWQTTVETTDETLLLVHNVAGARTVSIPIEAETIQCLYGKGEASYQNGVLEYRINGESTAIFRIYDEKPFGIYKNNMLLSYTNEGTVEINGAKKKPWLALYNISDGAKELIQLEEDTLSFEPKSDNKYQLSAFDWGEKMNPQSISYKTDGER